ncbi:MAG: hypothetical protein ABWY08_19775 [Comamonas sp.]
MPQPVTKILPPDFDTFMLPPAALANVPRPAMESLDLGLSGHAWARQELDSLASSHTAQAAAPRAEPGPASTWSPTDDLMAEMGDLDLGVSGHAWARQEMDSFAPSHTAQGAGQPAPAAQPYYMTRLLLLQQVLGQQGEPSTIHTANAAAAAEQEAEIAPELEFGDFDAPDTPDMPTMAVLLDALDASNAADAPMAPDAPITPETVFLEEAAEPAFTPMAGLLGSLALAGLIGLNPEGHFSSM